VESIHPSAAQVPEGGVPANMLLVTPTQLQGWKDVANGIKTNNATLIWQGNSAFANVEQFQTLQAILDLDLGLWKAATIQTIYSPMPDDPSDFQSFAPNASFGNPFQRYAWFKGKMVPAWRNVFRPANDKIDVQKLLRGEYK
jgi:hypothetical protein